MKLRSIIIITLALLCGSSSTMNALDKKPGVKLATLLKRIATASDPYNKAGQVTSQIMVFEVEIIGAQIKFSNTTILKAPNKRKMLTTIPKMMTETQVFDGKEGWQLNSRMGFQQLTGPALQFLKYTTISSNTMRFEDKFEKIELAEATTTVNGQECYKLTCYPPAEYKLKPQILYIDIKRYLTRKVEMVVVLPMGEVPSTALVTEYKKIAGFYLPTKMEITQMGMAIQMTLVSFTINQNISDAEFDKPKNRQTITPTP